MPLKYLWIIGLAATLGALVTGLGEWLMLYSPDMGYGAAAGYQNFLHPTESQISLGFYLGVLGAPLYILGYYHVSLMLRLSSAWRWVMMSLAVGGFMVGSVWLGTNAYLALLLQAGQTEILTRVDALSEPLLQIVRGSVLLLSAILVLKVLKDESYYPKWILFFTPLGLIVLIFIFFFIWPTVGNWFLPAALNIAHTLFFGISTALAYHLRAK